MNIWHEKIQKLSNIIIKPIKTGRPHSINIKKNSLFSIEKKWVKTKKMHQGQKTTTQIVSSYDSNFIPVKLNQTSKNFSNEDKIKALLWLEPKYSIKIGRYIGIRAYNIKTFLINEV